MRERRDAPRLEQDAARAAPGVDERDRAPRGRRGALGRLRAPPVGTSGGRRIVAHAAQGKHAQLVERPFGHVPPRGAGARDELLWVDVDELELARAVQQVVGHRLGGQVDPERAHAVLLVLQVADAQRRVHVDAGAQKLLGVLVARPVARVFGVWPGQVGQHHDVGPAGERLVEVEAPLPRRVREAVRHQHVQTARHKPLGLVEHGIGRTRAGRIAEEDLKVAALGCAVLDSVFPPCGAHHGRALH